MRHAWIAACALAAAPLPAAAHAVLLESDPAPDAVIAPGPAHIVLRFNSRIDAARSRVDLRSPPPGTPFSLPIQPGTPGTLTVDTPLTPGAWTLRWQVLAVDGHITRGEVPFTVRPR